MAKDWEHKANLAKNEALRQSFDSWTRQDLIDCILDLRKQLKQFESPAKKTGHLLSESISFNKAWPVATKIVFILSKENKPLLSSSIFSKLVQLDKSFLDYSLPKTVLSNYLSRSVTTKRIVKIKAPGFKAHYFALPEWLNEKGILTEEYKNAIAKF